jgi:protoporphyrinogen oxidase
MKIAIIGAGFTGLSAAYKLAKSGHDVTVFEKDPQPGGLAIGYQEKNWDWSLEKHYHHWFTNDQHVLNLAKDIGYEVLIKRPKTSVYVQGNIYQLDSPISILSFPLLSYPEKIRMAIVLAFLRFNPFWKPLEKINAATFLPKTMGKKAYKMLWEPQLTNKFGSFVSDVSLAWFWARIKKRTPSLAYPKKGFLNFANAVVTAIEKKGGKVLFNTEITQLQEGSSPTITVNDSRGKTNTHIFDRVIVTLPSPLFLKIAPQLPDDYKKHLTQLKSLGAINLVMRLKEKFFTDNTYWLSVCDNTSKVMAIVEHTNFMEKRFYNNEHLVYVGNYLPATHEYFKMNNEQLLRVYDPFLKKINPDYKKSLKDFEVFKVAFAQPIIPVNYSKMLPSFITPLKHVYLANIQQVYPWDRGTNYAVELGENIVDLILKD